jgi:uncharacterized protein (DUF2235 family)
LFVTDSLFRGFGFLPSADCRGKRLLKNIILCADGTWNTPHGNSTCAIDTNVRKLYCALTNDPSQLKYYDSGVGTDGTPLDHLSGGAMGEGLLQKVQDCYEFLSYVYDPGDKIFVLGFSRGAYTARSTAGMIAGFGVPTINLDNMTVKEIFAAYREHDAARKGALKADLKAKYGMAAATIQMVGVWDTVGSLGIPSIFFNALNEKQYGFLDTTIHPNVAHAYHAVSIDERRAQFKPTLWTNADGTPRANDNQVEQVWFPGAHSDVGGGYQECELSDIALSWMMHKAKENGLIFSLEAEAQYTGPPADDAYGPAHDEWKIIPWGIPEHRQVPPTAAMSNSVKMRLDDKEADYRPENLRLINGQISGYLIVDVLPYKATA